MTVWAVLASGPSMNQEVADYVRGKVSVVAVSDTYKLAPWADFLVSHDRSWWFYHQDAMSFKGRKFCRYLIDGPETFCPADAPSRCNSGLLGMMAARDLGKASQILLLGFDMQGTHFFGPHPEKQKLYQRRRVRLSNTKPQIRRLHLKQFKHWQGCSVINCTPSSMIETFPKAKIQDII